MVVSVRDNGVGIPPEMIPRVFELFTQVDASENRVHGGLGIGLTLSKTLAELHGGSLEAHSDGVGTGAIVDDNRDAADTLAILLRMIGIDVRVATWGAEALQAVDEYAPGILLLDIGMPVMDGYEVARRVRNRPDGSTYTLVALTGWGQDDDRARSSSDGFDHHLVKPADLEELQVLLASVGSTTAPPAASR